MQVFISSETYQVRCLLLEQSRSVLTSVVAYCSTSALVLELELLPAILAVVQPALRPVNTQLFSAR